MGNSPWEAAAPDIQAATEEQYRRRRIEHWDAIARRPRSKTLFGRAYHRRLQAVYRTLVAPAKAVLEVGCGDGDLLAALSPATGVGVDFSPAMVALAQRRHPHLEFIEADAHDLAAFKGPFDFIVLSDLVDDLWDVQRVFTELFSLCAPHTRIVLNSYSRLWGPLLGAAQALGLAQPVLPQNWLSVPDLANLLRLARFRRIRSFSEVLLPLPIPVLSSLANRGLVKFWPISNLALSNFLVARPLLGRVPTQKPTVSVVVPARNEAGNIDSVFTRTPELGSGTELIFVEGHSSDHTFEAIEQAIAAHPERRAKLLRQTGKGKGDAVRAGFAAASGDILMILDADLTVPPEDLPRFVEALVSGEGEFINGVRLVYPMERQAMRWANLLGNRFFSIVFSFLLGQPIKDTLCGTKVLSRSGYEEIARNRGHFGDFDPFGDFDLLFGAARLNLEIVEMPIRYRERTYGTTNIQRWRHGLLLLRMCVHAANRIKFI